MEPPVSKFPKVIITNGATAAATAAATATAAAKLPVLPSDIHHLIRSTLFEPVSNALSITVNCFKLTMSSEEVPFPYSMSCSTNLSWLMLCSRVNKEWRSHTLSCVTNLGVTEKDRTQAIFYEPETTGNRPFRQQILEGGLPQSILPNLSAFIRTLPSLHSLKIAFVGLDRSLDYIQALVNDNITSLDIQSRAFPPQTTAQPITAFIAAVNTSYPNLKSLSALLLAHGGIPFYCAADLITALAEFKNLERIFMADINARALTCAAFDILCHANTPQETEEMLNAIRRMKQHGDLLERINKAFPLVEHAALTLDGAALNAGCQTTDQYLAVAKHLRTLILEFHRDIDFRAFLESLANAFEYRNTRRMPTPSPSLVFGLLRSVWRPLVDAYGLVVVLANYRGLADYIHRLFRCEPNIQDFRVEINEGLAKCDFATKEEIGLSE